MKKIKSKIPIGYIIFATIMLVILISYILFKDVLRKCSIVFSIIPVAFIFYMIIRIYKISNVDNVKNKKNMIIAIISIIMIIFSMYVIYLKTEKNIKTWDNSCYWVQNIKFDEEYTNDAVKMVKFTINSINNDEYNLFPSLLLNSIFKFSDKTFLAYVLSVYLLYFVPVIILFNILIIKITNNKEMEEKTSWIICVIANIPWLLSPVLHFPIITGYLDVIGLIFVLAIINLFIDYNFEKLNFERIILIAISTLLLIISRRYFMFFILGFYMSYGLINFIYFIIKKEYKKACNLFFTLFTVTISVVLILLIIFRPMVTRVMESNIKNLYAGYKNGGFIYQLKDIKNKFSLVITGLSICGYISGLINTKTRKISLIMILNFIITTYLFSIIQNMGNHHIYLIITPVLLGISMLFLNIENMNKKVLKYIFLTLIFIVIIINFIVSFTTNELEPILSQKILMPRIRTDYDELINIRKDIDNIIKKDDPKIYIIGASENYNSETFQNIYYPDLSSGDIFVIPSNVDLTHGFRTSFYESNYVITITPIQYHLEKQHQQCVTILYNAIETISPLNDNFVLLKTWDNIENITINMYEKTNEFTEDDKDFLAEQFNISYSEYPELFYDRIKL